MQRFVSDGSISFFVALGKNNGQYISQGIVPAFEAMASKTPAIIGNRVFATASFNNSGNILLTEWRNDGLVVNKDTIHCVDSYVYYSQGVTTDNNACLLLSILSYSPVSFSNNIVANCNNQPNSNAVFALYHNPEFSTPYVGISSYGNKQSNLRIWPNPANNSINVVSDNNLIDYITIMDLNGKILMRKNVGNNIAILNVSLLPAGTYLLETVGKGEISVKKFVKHNMY